MPSGFDRPKPPLIFASLCHPYNQEQIETTNPGTSMMRAGPSRARESQPRRTFLARTRDGANAPLPSEDDTRANGKKRARRAAMLLSSDAGDRQEVHESAPDKSQAHRGPKHKSSTARAAAFSSDHPLPPLPPSAHHRQKKEQPLRENKRQAHVHNDETVPETDDDGYDSQGSLSGPAFASEISRLKLQVGNLKKVS
jgi:hypothetical protein